MQQREAERLRDEQAALECEKHDKKREGL